MIILESPGDLSAIDLPSDLQHVEWRGAASARVLFNARWVVTAAEGDLLPHLGWSCDGIVGQRVARLMTRALRQAARPVLHVLRTGAAVRADVMHENRLLHVDAHRITPTADGAIAQLDITDLTWDAASEHERAHVERLEAIGYVAAGISHEINTPVQFVSDNMRFLEHSLHELLGLAGAAREALDSTTLSPEELRATLHEVLSRVDATFIAEEAIPAFDAVRTGLDRISRVAGDLRAFAKPPREKRNVVIADEVALAAGLVRRELQRLPQVRIDVDERLPMLLGHAGDLAQILVSVLREVATHAQCDMPAAIAGERPSADLTLRAFARRDWVFITLAFSVPARSPQAFAWVFTPASDAPRRPAMADGFNVARALLREHYGGHIVIITEPDSRVMLTIGLPLHHAVRGAR